MEKKLPKAALKNFSVSSGTLNPDHLIEVFARFLMQNDYGAMALYFTREWFLYPDEQSETLDQVMRFIDEVLSPRGFYFGSHPGDGADFGFWQAEEE